MLQKIAASLAPAPTAAQLDLRQVSRQFAHSRMILNHVPGGDAAAHDVNCLGTNPSRKLRLP